MLLFSLKRSYGRGGGKDNLTGELYALEGYGVTAQLHD